MSPTITMSPTVTAAVIALTGVLLSALISYLVAGRRLAAEIKIANQRLLTEHRLNIASYEAIRTLLGKEEFQLRTFETFQRHLKGFEENELRKLLVASGAISFTSGQGGELWGLIERNEEILNRKG
jgi:hypothetical protein